MSGEGSSGLVLVLLNIEDIVGFQERPHFAPGATVDPSRSRAVVEEPCAGELVLELSYPDLKIDVLGVISVQKELGVEDAFVSIHRSVHVSVKSNDARSIIQRSVAIS